VCPQREQLVVEIGPGRGALTEKLLKRAERVVAVELEPWPGRLPEAEVSRASRVSK